MKGTPEPTRLDLLRRQSANLPELPGVYLMRDENQEVIYVGKAKDLKARVRTYFMGGDGRFQIDYLLQKVAAFETIVTQTEEQAFLLERDLITKYKPRYNIRLKDDKAYLCIRVDERAEWPRLELVRRTADDGAHYYGPYAFSGELRNILEVIRKVVPLRSCTDAVLYNRQRPCLEYQIRRCCAPCCLPIDRSEYLGLVKQATSILEGKTIPTEKHLTAKMEEASEALRFEEAAAWRDRLEILQRFQAGHSLISFRGENRDVFGLAREGTQATLCVLMVRSGRIHETKTFSLFDVRVSDDEILEAAMQQFYEGGREIPKEILIPREVDNLSMIEASLSAARGSSVSVLAPQRGSKARLLSMAEMNARQAFMSSLTFESEWTDVAQRLAETVGLKQIPRRVECVDISNFQGSDIVGAIVVFFDGVADKSSYRRYTISEQGKPNDFASIHEVVSRRLKRGMEEGNLPDLLVVDGGPGQLSMALQARDELRLSLDIVGLAKMRTESEAHSQEVKRKPERLYLEGREESLGLEEGDSVTRFLSKIRDEVHRFVITFHREKRSKRVFRSKLDDISGVSPEHKQRLLRHFKTIEAIGQASVEELAKVGRMPGALARKVRSVLSEGR
jgi:excinuclease ABC subunit C